MLSASAVLAAFWSNVRPPGLLFALEYLGSSTNVRHAMVRDFTTVIFPQAVGAVLSYWFLEPVNFFALGSGLKVKRLAPNAGDWG